MTDGNWIRLAPVVLASLVSLSLSGKTPEVVAESAIFHIVQDDETLAWMDDYDEAIALAKITGRPVFLEFRCSP